MAEMFTSGLVVDLILILVGIETVYLIVYWRATGRGVSPAALIPNLCAGAFLLIALRLALAGARWEVSCGSLAAAGLAHLADLKQRWRS